MSDSEIENELYRELLEKHIEKKVSEALKRRFSRQASEEFLEADGNEFASPSTSKANGDIVPIFDPDDKTLTVIGWLQKLHQEINKIYTKECFINGNKITAYLDNGSQVNIIHADAVDELKLQVHPTSTSLKAFGGSVIHVEKLAQFVLEIDGFQIETSALVTSGNMDNFMMIVGQPIINAEGVSLVVSSGKAKLIKNNCDLLNEITLDGMEVRPHIFTSEDVILYPKSTMMVKVDISDIGDREDMYMDNKHFPIGRNLVGIPGMVLRGSKGVIPVSNTGDQQITWEKGKLIGRGYRCLDSSALESFKVSVLRDNNVCKSFTINEVDINADLNLRTKKKKCFEYFK